MLKRTLNQSKFGFYSFDQSSHKQKCFDQWCGHTLNISFFCRGPVKNGLKICPKKQHFSVENRSRPYTSNTYRNLFTINEFLIKSIEYLFIIFLTHPRPKKPADRSQPCGVGSGKVGMHSMTKFSGKALFSTSIQFVLVFSNYFITIG